MARTQSARAGRRPRRAPAQQPSERKSAYSRPPTNKVMADLEAVQASVRKAIPELATLQAIAHVQPLLNDQLATLRASLQQITQAMEAVRTLPALENETSGRTLTGLEIFREFLRHGLPGGHSYVVLMGLSTFEPAPLLESIRKGFSVTVIDRLLHNTGLSFEQLTTVADIPRRTFTRRRRSGRLKPEESDRLLRASRVFGKTLQLFEGDRDAALAWLTRPQSALGDQRPLDVARTELGTREVEDLIERLDQGIFS